MFTPTLNAAEAVGVAARQRCRLVKNDETDAADQGLVQSLEEITRLLHATSWQTLQPAEGVYQTIAQSCWPEQS